MAVDVTIILVLKNATRVDLGVAAGVWYCVEQGKAIRSLSHVAPCLLFPISVAVVGAVGCSGRGCALICRHCRRALLPCPEILPVFCVLLICSSAEHYKASAMMYNLLRS